jgi:hypothetical protein
MVGGNLGDDFILVGEFDLELGEPFLKLFVRRAVSVSFKRGGVLEEFLLPAIEDRGMRTIFATEVSNRLLFQQMEPENFDFLLRRELSSGFLHGHLLSIFHLPT